MQSNLANDLVFATKGRYIYIYIHITYIQYIYNIQYIFIHINNIYIYVRICIKVDEYGIYTQYAVYVGAPIQPLVGEEGTGLQHQQLAQRGRFTPISRYADRCGDGAL